MAMGESGKEQRIMADQQKANPAPVTPALRAQCIQETLDCGNAAAVARRHHLPANRVRAWVREASKRSPSTTDPEVGQLEAENRHLKELLGDKDLEIAILKDLVKKTNRVPPRGAK